MPTASARSVGIFSPGTFKMIAFFVAGLLIGGASAIQLAPPGTGRSFGVAAPGSPAAAGTGAGEVLFDGDKFIDKQGNEVEGAVVNGAFVPDDPAGAAGNGARQPSAQSPGNPSAGAGTPNAGAGGTSDPGSQAAGTAPKPGGAPGAGGAGPSAHVSCASGRNGGATDQGVTGNQITLATTTVDSGPGASFLRDVRFGMEAVRNEVNRAGGICGRQLAIRYVDDGWDAQRGAQFLRNFINQPNPAEKIFAIPVGPSSEGLGVVIETGDIDKAQIPVVGTNGLSVSQYRTSSGRAQPWVWPVAAATVSSARIMAKHAYSRGARKFSIVFDRDYRFGKEAALAFNAEVKRLTGNDIPGFNTSGNCQPRFCGIESGQQSYSSQVTTFNRDKGDFVAMFLEPTTAQSWMADANTAPASGNGAPRFGYGAAQPLFTKAFAQSCRTKCHGMLVWTGFKPNLEGYRDDPAVRAYVSALKQTNPQADEFNQFAQGGYVGMQLLVAALRKVGPNLTRQRLKAALDSIDLRSGLTMDATQKFRADNRFTATTMQAFSIQYQGTFSGWRAGPKVTDPRPTAGAG